VNGLVSVSFLMLHPLGGRSVDPQRRVVQGRGPAASVGIKASGTFIAKTNTQRTRGGPDSTRERDLTGRVPGRICRPPVWWRFKSNRPRRTGRTPCPSSRENRMRPGYICTDKFKVTTISCGVLDHRTVRSPVVRSGEGTGNHHRSSLFDHLFAFSADWWG